MSPLSWGENVTIVVESAEQDSTTTIVTIDSRLRMGTNFFAGGRHEQNFMALLEGIQGWLESPNTGPAPPIAAGSPGYQLTIRQLGNVPRAKLGRILNDFLPNQFDRGTDVGDLPLDVMIDGYATAEGLRSALARQGADVEISEV
jgi:hypothetical protein